MASFSVYLKRKRQEADDEARRQRPNTFSISPQDLTLLRESTREAQLSLKRSFMALSEEQALRISRHEQGTQEWLDSRRGRLTGSVAADVVDYGKRLGDAGLRPDTKHPGFGGSWKKRLQQLVWPECNRISSRAMSWGSDHEDSAERAFLDAIVERNPEWTGVTITHAGLIVLPGESYFAYSPDGILSYTDEDGESCVDLVEYKCPYSKRATLVDELYGPTLLPPTMGGQVPGGGLQRSLRIPVYYYDQARTLALAPRPSATPPR